MSRNSGVFPKCSCRTFLSCSILPHLTWQTLPMMWTISTIAVVPMRDRPLGFWRRLPAANRRIQFRQEFTGAKDQEVPCDANRRVRPGLLATTMLALLGGEAVAQTGPAAGGVPPTVAQTAASDRSVYLRFYGSEWGTVMKKVAEQSGSILVMHETPPGRLVLREKNPFNRHEAVLILNQKLESTGFRILESHQYLIVLASADDADPLSPAGPGQPAGMVPQPGRRSPIRAGKDLQAVRDRDHRQGTKPPQRQRTSQPLQLVGGTKPVPLPAEPAAGRSPPQGNSNPIATPTSAGELPAGWTSQSLTPKNRVRDLAGRVYETLKDRAELIDAGALGLPAFRVQFPPTPDKPGPEGFEVAIDIPQNRLVFASTPERLKLLSGLFRYLDRQNAFEQPIQLVAADEKTAELAKNLTPEIEKIDSGAGEAQSEAPSRRGCRQECHESARAGMGVRAGSSPAAAGERPAAAERPRSRSGAARSRTASDHREFQRQRADSVDSRTGHYDSDRQQGRRGRLDPYHSTDSKTNGRGCSRRAGCSS